MLSQLLRDLCDASNPIQAEARTWLMSKRSEDDRKTTCELAGVDPDSFIEFTRKCVKNYDQGGKASMLNAAKYLYAGLKSTDAESNFMNSPDGYADDSDLLDGVSEL